MVKIPSLCFDGPHARDLKLGHAQPLETDDGDMMALMWHKQLKVCVCCRPLMCCCLDRYLDLMKSSCRHVLLTGVRNELLLLLLLLIATDICG